MGVTARVEPTMTAADLEVLWAMAAAEQQREERHWALEPEAEPSGAKEEGQQQHRQPEEQRQQEEQQQEEGGGGGCKGRLLVGLHSCGELTPTVMKVFGSQTATPAPAAAAAGAAPKPKGLVVVGCCYNLLAADPVATAARAPPQYGKPDPTADEVVFYPLRDTSGDLSEDLLVSVSVVASSEGEEGLPLLLDRRLCAAAAESTNPAFVQRNYANSGGGKQKQKQGGGKQGSKNSSSGGGGGGGSKVSSLRPRRLARALLQRRLLEDHPEVYARSTTLKLKTSQFKPFEYGSYAYFIQQAMESAGVRASSNGVPMGSSLQNEQVVDTKGSTEKEGDGAERQAEAAAAATVAVAVLESEWERAWLEEGAKLKLFYLMREALAPLVEAVLLVDRGIFLTEKLGLQGPDPGLQLGVGADAAAGYGDEADRHEPGATRAAVEEGVVRLFPLFEPGMSPRNICTFASSG